MTNYIGGKKERLLSYVIGEIQGVLDRECDRLSDNWELADTFGISKAQVCVYLSNLGEENVRLRNNVLFAQRERDLVRWN
jgi:hypothetical protein